MAILKSIKLDNSIVVNYHRILYLNITTNRQNSIAVVSYIDERSRLEEKENNDDNIYKYTKTYETDYNELMSIEDAYNYLSSLPEFQGGQKI